MSVRATLADESSRGWQTENSSLKDTEDYAGAERSKSAVADFQQVL